MRIEFDSISEFKEFIDYINGKAITDVRPMSDAERSKKYRENKKQRDDASRNCDENVTECDENVTECKEERENEKENKEKERSKEKENKEKVKEKEENIYICAEPQKPKPEKPVKHRYGNFQHVLLTDDELTRIKADFPDWPERIQRLDDYLENTGKVYKNHALTIRNWASKDALQPKQIPKEKTFRDLRIEMENQAVAIAPADDFIDSFWRT